MDFRRPRLRQSSSHLRSHCRISTPGKCLSIFHYLVDGAYWKQPMLASGWCPSQIKVSNEKKFRLQTLHFLTLLGQPAGDGLHERCDSDRCLGYQNDMASYQTKHITGCNCEHLLIDTKYLAEILESGCLPLLQIQPGNALSELSVEIVPSHSTSCYIALSHVRHSRTGVSDFAYRIFGLISHIA